MATDAMTLEELIPPESVLCNAQARSKKHCLEILSELLASTAPDIPNEEIFSRLVERERLGCTGLEKGTAFPHCRIEGLKRSSGALIKLSEPIDFDTSDGENVDLVIGLMVPTQLDETHLSDIRLITEVLDDDALRARLRSSNSSSQLYRNLMGQPIDGESDTDADH
jgi:PTS system nitrogen regulatory IIA component